jgi:hypothetical protein
MNRYTVVKNHIFEISEADWQRLLHTVANNRSSSTRVDPDEFGMKMVSDKPIYDVTNLHKDTAKSLLKQEA